MLLQARAIGGRVACARRSLAAGRSPRPRARVVRRTRTSSAGARAGAGARERQEAAGAGAADRQPRLRRRWRAWRRTSIGYRSATRRTRCSRPQNAVNLMTVHASKGLEFPVVFLVNLGRGVGAAQARGARAHRSGNRRGMGGRRRVPVGSRRARAGRRARGDQAAAVRRADPRARSALPLGSPQGRRAAGPARAASPACCRRP